MVTEEKVNPLRRPIVITWVLLLVNLAVAQLTGQPLVNEAYLLFGTNVFQALAVGFQIYHFITEFKGILKIDLFKIQYQKQN
mmetsp:Transcript_40628/g.61913  ORF Transcript_40628/g.61913 Transcript_40628/m.61913 type:complete len:82 (+) Transcript_40628:1129-1374(+)